MANVWQANYWAGGSRTYNNGHNGYDPNTGYCNLVSLGQMIAGRYSGKDNVTCLRFACNDNSCSNLHFYINNYSDYTGQGTVKILVRTSELSSVTKTALDALGSVTREYTCVNSSSGYSELNEFDLTYNFIKGTVYYIYIWGKTGGDWGDTWRFRWYPPNNTFNGFAVTYTIAIYTISYNANGGSGAPAAQTKDWGVSLTLSSTKPTKADTTSTSTGTITISYNANGGSSTPSAGTGTYTDTTTTIYAFNNWNTAPNGTGTFYNSGASYTANATATLYAQYTGSSTTSRTSNPSIKTAAAISRSYGSETGYKVTFNANGGSFTPSAITSTKTITYSFSKWKNLDSGMEFSASTSYTFSVNATLTAQWTSTSSNNAITLPAAIKRSDAVTGTYTITYDANGGVCSKTSEVVNRVSSYSFSGWNTKADGSGTNYNASSSYTPSTTTTLHAKWNTTTTTNQTTLPTPTRLGYTFLGWAESPNASYGVFGLYTPKKDIKLYAIWGALGSVKIKDKDGIHSYVPFIYTNNQWVRAVPFVRTKDTWIRAGGD